MSREFAFPGTRPRYAPDRVVDIQHIALVLEVDPSEAHRRGHGDAALRGDRDRHEGRRARCGRADDREGHASTASRAAFRHDGKKLRVELPSRARRAELVIAIEYKGAPRRGLYFIGARRGLSRTSRCRRGRRARTRTPVLVPVLRRAEREGDERGARSRCRRRCSRCRTACSSRDKHEGRQAHAALAARRAAQLLPRSRSRSATSRRSRRSGATCRSSTTCSAAARTTAERTLARTPRDARAVLARSSACRIRIRATRRCSSPTSSSAAWRTRARRR